MKAILVKEPGGIDKIQFGETEKPVITENEILIHVKAAGINRADVMQRQGKYPPPKGASEILGLEISGEVVHAPRTGTSAMDQDDRVLHFSPPREIGDTNVPRQRCQQIRASM